MHQRYKIYDDSYMNFLYLIIINDKKIVKKNSDKYYP